MNRYIMCVGVLMMGACAAPAPPSTSPTPASPVPLAPDSAHNARNALDWAGVYRGVLPCADCPGIDIAVVLRADGTYVEQTKYRERGDAVFIAEGAFAWNAAGSAVALAEAGAGGQTVQYFVAENRLIRLALDGSRIGGALADRYVLEKKALGITDTYWKLVELNGRPVPAQDREPHLVLSSRDARAVGYSGCNGFSGAYKLDEATLRISFADVASTMMACVSGMETESAFLQALRTADNYFPAGDRLVLNRARMAPLARFEAVYVR